MKTLGAIAKIDSKQAAQNVQRNRFSHDVLNQIAKYRIRLMRAEFQGGR